MDEWTKFLAHSLGKRLDADKFGKFAHLLNKKHSLPPRRIADVLLRPNRHNHESLDPQIPHYLQTLLHGDLLDTPAVLYALLSYSSFRSAEESKPDTEDCKGMLKWNKSYTQAEGIIYGLAKLVSSGSRPKDAQEALDLTKALTEWTKVLSIPGAAEDIMHETHTTEASGVRIALGALLVAAVENGKVLGVLGKSCPKGISKLLPPKAGLGIPSLGLNWHYFLPTRGACWKFFSYVGLTIYLPEKLKAFSQSIANFTPLLLHSSAMIAERLDQFRTQSILPLLPIDKKTQAANDEIDKMIDSSLALGIDTVPVIDLPTVNSRAGLYVYLHSLVSRFSTRRDSTDAFN
jgi:mediator of RNA polymerase II transcription subunit 5